MKRFLSIVLCMTLLLTLALPLCASATGEGWYVVDSDSPKGYCYLYSTASDWRGQNLGRYDNGEKVYVMDYFGGKDGKLNYCYVQTEDGKTGYMHDYSLTRYYDDTSSEDKTGWYIIRSKDPNGYCYLYSEPSDRDGMTQNMGRHENGELVYVIEYYGGRDGDFNYCYVRTMDSNETGYMHDYALTPYTEGGTDDPKGGWYTVWSREPRGYCYLYSEPSDRDGMSQNMGRYNNGESVYVLEYRGGQDGRLNYCYVKTQDGRYGYMHDYALIPQ